MDINTLIKKARQVEMTQEQREQQRRSFAYGNAKIENERITREAVNRAADTLKTESSVK